MRPVGPVSGFARTQNVNSKQQFTAEPPQGLTRVAVIKQFITLIAMQHQNRIPWEVPGPVVKMHFDTQSGN